VGPPASAKPLDDSSLNQLFDQTRMIGFGPEPPNKEQWVSCNLEKQGQGQSQQ
jgi:hypothetical protein